ncbi:hypothetical protein BX666DRAFT_369503 [Dichotomocladium elegans]|nr:hypothetical protein BX666DRAFT_369503 [Dichotomocladium elegans]
MTNSINPNASMGDTAISKARRSNSYKKKRSSSKQQPQQQLRHEATTQVAVQQKKSTTPSAKSSRRRRSPKRDEVPELSSGATSSSSSESDSDNNISHGEPRASRLRRVDRLQQQPQQQQQLRSSMASPMQQVYCGPCFSNAPPPSTLPIPAFHHQQHHHVHMDPLKQQSKQLLNLLQPAPTSNFAPTPAVIKAAHHPLDTDLSEIQRGLWSMLKISA